MTKCCDCEDAATHYCLACEYNFCERHAGEHQKITDRLFPTKASIVKIGENPDAKID
jgi:hypothetical protein